MKYHRTREGHRVPLAGMSDNHLRNTIQCFSEAVAELTRRMDEVDCPQSNRARALYGSRKPSDQEYREVVKKWYEDVGPYFAEAATRGLDVSDLAQKALGRTSREEDLPSAEQMEMNRLTEEVIDYYA